MRCNDCKRENLNKKDFYKDRTRKNGYCNYCKTCMNTRERLRWRAYTPKAKERKRLYREEWKNKNKVSLREKERIYQRTHREKHRTDYAKRIIENRELKKINKRRCPGCLTVKCFSEYWNIDNRCKVCIKFRERLKYRKLNGVGKRFKPTKEQKRLRQAVSSHIYISLKSKKGGASWEGLVGYTVKDLIGHLEGLFLEGMTWENYGLRGWHLDHIVPVSAFNFESPKDIDFKRCWALSNLQPLWARDNLSKNSKLTEPFQPALKIEA